MSKNTQISVHLSDETISLVRQATEDNEFKITLSAQMEHIIKFWAENSRWGQAAVLALESKKKDSE